MSNFKPIESQEELDRILQPRVGRVQAQLQAEREHSRRWENRAKQNLADARRWEATAEQNQAVIEAHERTIAMFIEKLDDVLNED